MEGATRPRRRRGYVRWEARGEAHQITPHVVAAGGAVRELSGKVSRRYRVAAAATG